MRSRRHLSHANWRKIIEDFRSAYQLRAPWEIVLIELLANSIDAGSSRVEIEIQGECPKIVRVLDEGKGMTQNEFAQYHNLGSLSKHRGSGIGWAGIGAKLYLDRCASIYTETRSESFAGASKWFLPKGPKEPIWDEIESRRLLCGARGTVVEIMVTDRRECQRISIEGARDTVLAHFNYALRPLGHVVLTLNRARVSPFDPSETVHSSSTIPITLQDGSVAEGTFFLLDRPAPTGFNLVSLVVHSKTIGENYDFHQGARIKEPERVAGFVRCDRLIRIVTTAKDSFNRKTSLWRDFDSKVGRAFSRWLQSVGQLESVSSGRKREELARHVEDHLNRIFKLPEVRDLRLDPFHSSTKTKVPVPDSRSEQSGKEVLGSQIVHGILGTEDAGGGVSALGDSPGASFLPHPNGLTKITEEERLIRSGVRIHIQAFPDKSDAAWMDFADQAIVVNESHPAFRCADSMSGEQFYTIEACFSLLCDAIADDAERHAAISKLFLAYLAVGSEPEASSQFQIQERRS